MKTLTHLSALALGLTLSTAALAKDKVLNIYNWSDYIAPDTVEKFEQATGIKVNYDVYDSNEVLEAKLMSGSTGYDLVIPTGYFLERQIKAGIYQPIATEKLSNYANLDAELKQKVTSHDPDNRYSVPYAWGTIGLGYNKAMLQQRLGDMPVDTLDLIFKPEITAKLADCGVALFDSPAEVVAIALNYLGLDPNSEKKADLEKVSALLKEVRPHYKYFHSGKYISDLANGEICVALGYNGDVLQAKSRAQEAGQGQDIGYAIPREGTLIWFDLMAIPADAPHPDAAHQFIDFVLTPEIGASLSNYVFYAVPNRAAEPLISAEVHQDPGIYPDATVKAKLFSNSAHTAKFDRLLTRAWSNIKTGR